MIPKKIPPRDLPAEYRANAERRFDPATLRPGFAAVSHPEPERKVPEAPSAEMDLPDSLKQESPEAVPRESVGDAKDAEARATQLEGEQ